jgi:hypothetical protein
MQLSFATDERDRLTCVMSDGRAEATIGVSGQSAALSALAEALETTAATGSGECYWRQAGGEYRWVFRRAGEKVRIVVLWSAGTLTGWEHVFWSECDFEAFDGQVRKEVSGIRAASAGA